ncbi:hypothetical protein PTTG_28735 [Puccinia triticina 1-1 BBBD Race 1]|uniref:Uncharacterized protein n=1 Tax=Puccinia triticina (isolate 1-1 / race 1 (BBBD)) TaxID=630390 RepID=A0A180G9D9_PUCT1|nr:hypothetical protein PTTG_28735 [Puccinia triticina 1-1 BBBD Race 1]
MFNVLQPLVTKFLEFLTGVWYPKTSRAQSGQKIRAIMLPLIANIPALRKVAWFASHSVTLFCSLCKLSRQQIDIVDPGEFPLRKHRDHMEWARKWLEISNLTQRDAKVKEHGVCYSPLNKQQQAKKLKKDLTKLQRMNKSTQGAVFEFILQRRKITKKRAAEEPEHAAKQRLTTQNLQALASSKGPGVLPAKKFHTSSKLSGKSQGSASGGSLKEAEWGILYSVFHPLVLLPLWEFCNANPDCQILSKNLVQIVHITHLLNHRMMTTDKVGSIQKAIQQYRTHTLTNWTEIKSKPNIHIMQHFPKLIERFGPPAAFAAWAHKRLNGGKPKQTTIRNDEAIHGSKERLAASPIKDELYNKWLHHLNNYTSQKWICGATGDISTDSVVLSPIVRFWKSFRHCQNKDYTVESVHKGNSYVHFRLSTSDLFGSIQTVFSLAQIPNHTFLEVALFVDLADKDNCPKPFCAVSSLHYQLLGQPNPAQTLVLFQDQVVRHVACLTNPPGVFGVETETISIAVVHHLVSAHPQIQPAFYCMTPLLTDVMATLNRASHKLEDLRDHMLPPVFPHITAPPPIPFRTIIHNTHPKCPKCVLPSFIPVTWMP